MKLESVLMRDAFAAEDWPTAIGTLESFFAIKISNRKQINIYKEPDHYPEMIVYAGPKQYLWSPFDGFRQYIGYASGSTWIISIYTNIKPWKF